MQRWQRWMTTTGPFYSLDGRTNQDSGSRVWGGRLRFRRWGLGQWLYIRPKDALCFSFVTVSRASLFLYVRVLFPVSFCLFSFPVSTCGFYNASSFLLLMLGKRQGGSRGGHGRAKPGSKEG